ncbi:MAG TPA: SDR family NAD(P)-dependent oxidoreductase [Candidatus Polarisedimenticolia bacterium]|nr:SDR family NAD(P)-dependent oxidoreductase [Candidatus Polarisedimenticolia bacterium]
MNDLRFDGQTVLVTGAGRGIGAAVAGAFETRGAVVYRLDVERPAETGERFIVADVTRSGDVDRAVASILGAGGRLDAVVACAGIIRDHVLWKMSDDDWRAVLAVNLDGAFHLLRAVAPHFKARQGGAAVLVSSINAERGKFGQANYAASKAGLIGLAKTAARELGRSGARVNVVAPGFIDTPMTRALPQAAREAAAAEAALGRIGAPEDVAFAVLFLCSRLAGHITGQVLRVDGGQYI